MRKLIVITSVAFVLVSATSALAVLPSQKSVFRGYTSEHKVNGFKPTIQFTAQPGGRTLTNFVFQTLGCFGSGQFPVGVDPFAEMPWRLPKVAIPATGSVTTKVKATSTALDSGQMAVTFTGKFTSASNMTGKITYSQSQSGATCGPKTVTFSVSTNNPVSLGP